MYIDKLDNTVKKYSNTYHRTIKIKTYYVNSSTYFEFKKENNKEDPKFKIQKYKNGIAKSFIPNCSEETIVI